jgi:Na+-transporting NADH:ubiquinone oxidoreductase subunit C
MKDRAYIIVFMVVLAAVFGGAVAGIYLASESVLARNKELRLQRAYLEVFGMIEGRIALDEVGPLVERRIELGETIVDPETSDDFQVIKGYADDAHEELIGMAFRFRGMGFWSPIEGLLALNPDRTRTLGIVILEQKETPGLGGRIEEPIFTKPFEQGVKVSLPGNATEKIIEISSTTPDPQSPMAPRHVMAITGATQTSMALDRILNENLAAFHRAMEAK